MSVATFPAFIFLSNVALVPHSVLISSGSVVLDFVIIAGTFFSTSLFLAPFFVRTHSLITLSLSFPSTS